MRNSKSEPILKSTKNNFGNGYGQYCILDYGPVKQSSKKIFRDKIKIRIGTPVVSNEDLRLTELENNDEYKSNSRHKLFIAGIYVTTLLIIGLEYWYFFKN